MEITVKFLESEMQGLQKQREGLIGNVNMCHGALQTLEQLKARLLAPEEEGESPVSGEEKTNDEVMDEQEPGDD